MTKPTDLVKHYEDLAIKREMDKIRANVTVAVYSIDNYFNMGAIIRMCHNFKVKAVIGVDCPKHYRKADLGTRKYENILRYTKSEFIQMCTFEERNVVGFESPTTCTLPTTSIIDYKYPDNPILLFGSEKTGLPPELLGLCLNNIISIPMYGVHNDHNVSVATSIALYDFCVKHPDQYQKSAVDVIKELG